jgi:hypothetical protein
MDEGNVINEARIVFELADRHLNHQSICALGLVNKSCNWYMDSEFNNRKRRLGDPQIGNGKLLSSVIHKSGSARCFVYTTLDELGDLKLHMRYVQCNSRTQTLSFKNFVSPLPHNPVLFLNEQKKWCFDGRGKRQNFIGDVVGGAIAYEVIRYHLSGDELPLIVLMLNDSGNGFIHCKAANFRNYPSLLKSILAVKQSREKYCEEEELTLWQIDTFSQKKYFLEINFNDVVLAQDWDKKEKLLHEESFFILDHHPTLKKIIEKYYKRQQDMMTWCVIHSGKKSLDEIVYL